MIRSFFLLTFAREEKAVGTRGQARADLRTVCLGRRESNSLNDFAGASLGDGSILAGELCAPAAQLTGASAKSNPSAKLIRAVSLDLHKAGVNLIR